eukprot:5293123-Amphidinium_carterae.2
MAFRTAATCSGRQREPTISGPDDLNVRKLGLPNWSKMTELGHADAEAKTNLRSPLLSHDENVTD